MRRPVLGAIATALGGAAIGAITLVPVPPSITLPVTCIICGSLGGIDFVLNILLFVPLGMGVAILSGSARKTILAGLVLSLLVEAVQYFFISGRYASVGDVLTNTTGAGLGAWIVGPGVALFRCGGSRAVRPALAAGVLASALILATAWLLRPETPPAPQQVQWMVTRSSTEPFPGVLHAATLDGHGIVAVQQLRPHEVVDPSTGTSRLDLVISDVRKTTQRRAIILRVAGWRGEGLYTGQWRDALLFRTHQVANRWRFRPILLKLEGAFDTSVAGQITVAARSDPLGMEISVAPGGVATSLPRTVGLAWTLVVPWDVAVSPNWWPVNAAWLAGLILPVGFFATRGGQGNPGQQRRTGWLALVLVAAVLFLAPRVAGIGPTTILEWSGAGAGILGGVLLARLTRDSVAVGT